MATEKIEDKDKEKKKPAASGTKTARTAKTGESAAVKKTAPKVKASESESTAAAAKAPKAASEAKAAGEVKVPKAASEGKAAGEVKATATPKPSAAKQASPKAPKAEKGPKHTPRLKQHYDSVVVKALSDLYKYSSPMAIPKVVKVILNIGIGEATSDKTVVDAAVEELTTIAAQKAVKTFAKKSISNFHLREGMPIGARVTLRGSRMYDFIDKFISVALPRVRDFKGLSSSSFDGRGNYTIGLKEQLVFPEINYDKITKIRGMDVTIVTTAANDDEAYQLLKTLGFPFKEK